MPERAHLQQTLTTLHQQFHLQAAEALREIIHLRYKQTVLETLVNLFNEASDNALSDEGLAQGLQTFLAENWQQVKHTALSYTALPRDEVTLLLCMVSEFVKTHLPNQEDTASALLYLMPNISIERLGDGANPLLEQALPLVLQTHIISDSGHYLIPITQLPEILNQEENSQYNFYHDYASQQKSESFIQPSEIERLCSHSPSTKALQEAHQHYSQLENNTDNLLSRLKVLCAHLYLNSANGVGQEVNAADGAYPSIIRFNDYYTTLNEKEKSKLPETVKHAIERLLQLASDSNENNDATRTLATCIATRQKRIFRAMRAHQTTLETIGLSEEHHRQLLSEARHQVAHCQQTLLDQINDGRYLDGYDELGYTKPLLDALNIDLHIHSLRDLNEVMQLKAGDIETLLADPAIASQVRNVLNTRESLIGYLHDTPTDKLPLLVNLCHHLIRRPAHLSALLMSFDETKMEAVWQAMKPFLSGILKTTAHLGQTLRLLSPQQRTFVYEQLAEHIPQFIKTARDFNNILIHLTPEQCMAMYEQLKERLPQIIQSSWDFSQVLKPLVPEQRRMVYEQQKKHLPQFIKSSSDIGAVLCNLTPNQCRAVCEKYKAHFLTVFKTEHDGRGVLCQLTPEQTSVVCEVFSDRIIQLLTHSSKVWSFLKPLTPEQCAVVWEQFGAHLLQLIKTSVDVNTVLLSLSPEQKNVVYEKLKNHLPELIKRPLDFNLVLSELTPEQRTEVFDQQQAQLSQIIKTTWDLELVFKYLSPEQRTQVYERLNNQEQLHQLLKTASDLELLLNHLSPEQQAQVYGQLQAQLPQLIKTASDFELVLSHLSHEHQTEVYERLKEQLPQLIKTASDFELVLSHLSPDQRTEVYVRLQEQLPQLIKTASDFELVLNHLSPEQRAQAYEQLKEQLPQLIETADCLHLVLSHLSPEQRTEVYERQKQKLPKIINTTSDFTKILSQLSLEQCTEVTTQLKNHFPNLIETARDFRDVMYKLTPEKRLIVFARLIERLPKIIITGVDFYCVLVCLTPEQGTQVVEHLAGHIPKIIQSANDFHSLLESMPPQHRKRLYEIFVNQYASPFSVNSKLEEYIESHVSFERLEEIQQFLFNHRLSCLRDKASQFVLPEHQKAREAAQTLHTRLTECSQAYYQNTIDYRQFRQTCQQAIDEARVVLQEHRGWKEFLAKLVLTLVSLGTIPLGIAAYNKATHGSFQFRLFKTNSEKTLDKLENTVTLCPRLI